MSLTIRYNHPHFPEGTVFGIPYIGEIENGGSIEVDEEAERQYLVATGKPLTEVGNDIMAISGDSSLSTDELSQFTVTDEDIYGIVGKEETPETADTIAPAEPSRSAATTRGSAQTAPKTTAENLSQQEVSEDA